MRCARHCTWHCSTPSCPALPCSVMPRYPPRLVLCPCLPPCPDHSPKLLPYSLFGLRPSAPVYPLTLSSALLCPAPYPLFCHSPHQACNQLCPCPAHTLTLELCLVRCRLTCPLPCRLCLIFLLCSAIRLGFDPSLPSIMTGPLPSFRSALPAFRLAPFGATRHAIHHVTYQKRRKVSTDFRFICFKRLVEKFCSISNEKTRPIS